MAYFTSIRAIKYIFDTFGLDLNKCNNVLEYGGGYGNLCKLFYNVGYKNKYHWTDYFSYFYLYLAFSLLL